MTKSSTIQNTLLPNIKIESKPALHLPNNFLRTIFLFLIISNMILAVYCFQGDLASILSSNIREFLSLVVIVSSGLLGEQVAIAYGQDTMLGMLAAGVVMRNIFPYLILDIPHAWTSILWTLALCSVISRAGLSLQKDRVLPHLREALMLGLVPVLTETFALSTMARLFFGLPTPWAFTLAFGVSSISPGVVVPLILRLLDNGWQKSRLPPILLTALGIDVLVGTSGFGISLASSFGHSHEHQQDIFHDSWIARGAEEIMVGVFLGALVGLLSHAHLKFKLSDSVSTYSVYLLSTACMIWCKTSGFTGAASCSTFIAWSTVANTWPRGDVDRADQRLKLIWLYFKPFLFPVIGSTISLTSIPLSHIALSLSIVACSMAVKMGAAYWTGIFSGLDRAESFFVCGLWTGKASIQATLCSAALEMVHRHGLDEQGPEAKYAKIVFLCMVSSIVLGVPSASTWVKLHGKVPLGLREGHESSSSLQSLTSPMSATHLLVDEKEIV